MLTESNPMPDNTTPLLERIAALCEQINMHTQKIERHLATIATNKEIE